MAECCSTDLFEKRCFDIFAEVLSPKIAAKKWKEVYYCIRAVDCGIKNSYLVDQCCVSPEQMTRLVRRLYIEDFLSREDLDIVVIFQDIFVIQKDSVLRHLSGILNEDKICFVDVSQGLPEPKMLNEREFKITIKNFCLEFTEFLKQPIKPFGERENIGNIRSSLIYNSDLNPCTIFGVILGYPVVYWCNEKSITNCLSERELTVHSISLQSLKLMNKSLTVFSFSLPVSLTGFCEKYINSWKDRVCNISDKLVGLVAHVSCEQVRLPVVVL